VGSLLSVTIIYYVLFVNVTCTFLFVNIACYILEKKFALRTTKKINNLPLLNETKNHNPPLQVKWSVPNGFFFIHGRVMIVALQVK
jgi:hypothetical protein